MSLQSSGEWILPKSKTENVVEHILKVRGIKEKEKFLNPNIKDIPTFEKLHDSRKAAEKIIKSIKKGYKIVIHGDYDADGICATSLLWKFLYRDVATFLKKEVDILPYIPDRVEQGYGLTRDSLNDLAALGAKLVITVDCGVRDRKLIEEFVNDKGMEFVVTDHHLPAEDVSLKSIKYTLVHQMFPKKEYPYLEICGTSVIYLLIQAIREELGMPNLPQYGLDLVALATVTDIMPLTGVNRIFVKEGLEEIRRGRRVGLRALILRAGLRLEEIDTYHLGFVLGPRINASGRIASPLDAVRLLVSNSEQQCKEIANLLEMTNFERQRMTAEIFLEAKESIDDLENKLLFLVGEDWHEGIIGLVAGKLQQTYHRPVIVATRGKGVVKGSARSIEGFNITNAFEMLGKYLDRYGGHELAAGFTVSEENVVKFKKELLTYANKEITEEQLRPKTNVEILLRSEDIAIELVNELRRLEPLGFGNPKPVVCIENLLIKTKQIMGREENHLKLFVQGEEDNYLTLLLFGCEEDVETLKEGDSIDIIGYPSINRYNGKESIQFNVKEWRFVN